MTDAEKVIVQDALGLLNDGLNVLSSVEEAHPLMLVMVKLVQGIIKSTELMLGA